MTMQTTCELVALGICWTSVAAWMLGYIPIILASIASLMTIIWLGFQIYDRNKKQKQIARK